MLTRVESLTLAVASAMELDALDYYKPQVFRKRRGSPALPILSACQSESQNPIARQIVGSSAGAECSSETLQPISRSRLATSG